MHFYWFLEPFVGFQPHFYRGWCGALHWHLLRFGCNCAFQRFSTVLIPTVCPHLVSVHGQTPQPVTRVAGENGLMSLAPTNGASVWLAKEKPYGQKITFHKWMTCTCVVSFEITNNKRKSCLRVETMCNFLTFVFFVATILFIKECCYSLWIFLSCFIYFCM